MTLGWPASLAPTRLSAAALADRQGRPEHHGYHHDQITRSAAPPLLAWFSAELQAQGLAASRGNSDRLPGSAVAARAMFRAAGRCTFNADPGLPPEWQGSSRLTREHRLPAGAACPVEEAILLLEDRGQQSGWLCVASRSAIISA